MGTAPTTTHLAGPVVGFRSLDRVIQRCALCGIALDDYRPSCVATSDGAPPPKFAEGNLIRIAEFEGGRHCSDLGDFTTQPLPEDFCLHTLAPDEREARPRARLPVPSPN